MLFLGPLAFRLFALKDLFFSPACSAASLVGLIIFSSIFILGFG